MPRIQNDTRGTGSGPGTRALFHLPEGITYLDGNSLGPLPVGVQGRVSECLQQEWGEQLIGGWNGAGWMALPRQLGDRIARLIGAPEGTVTLGDTLSIKVYQALAAALALHPERRRIVSDTGNFPSDLYMAEGLINTLGNGYHLHLVEPGQVAAALDDSVAALMLTHVDYRTARCHDMAELTARAHKHRIPVIWDLAHSAGAVPLDLHGCDVDFAVGCTYKYLNGGPGAPAFIHVAERLHDQLRPALSGWLGHDAPFAFELGYRAASGIDCLRIGTPPVLALSALESALDAFDQTDMQSLRTRSIVMSERFIAAVDERCPALTPASPRDPNKRGSHVSFHTEHGYEIMQALIKRHHVVGDFRAPDLLRFGITPLYLNEDDIDCAVGALIEVLDGQQWRAPEFAFTGMASGTVT